MKPPYAQQTPQQVTQQMPQELVTVASSASQQFTQAAPNYPLVQSIPQTMFGQQVGNVSVNSFLNGFFSDVSFRRYFFGWCDFTGNQCTTYTGV